jgi:hypothetical protein
MEVNTESSKKSLLTILKEQPELYDLHAHLLGMGNAGFWIDTILMDESIMPKNEIFKCETDKTVREALCPLVWDKNTDTGFVNGKKAAEFFNFLIEANISRSDNTEQAESVGFEEATKQLENFTPVLKNLIDETFYNDLIHGGLEFKDDFSYDVVLKLSDLRKGLGIKDSECEGFVQLAVTEKLGGHLPDRSIRFQHWIIFDARKQKFDIVYGIQVAKLRDLIRVNPEKPSEAAKLARAHIINAFSMCDAEGTGARPIDFHNFHGCFTPDFYPRRFALKDSIYHQRLDVLAALIAHILERYQTCLPPVTYCELSVSVNDITSLWVFDVLRSVRVYDQEAIRRSKKEPQSLIYEANEELSSFSQIVLNDHFPYLQGAFKGPVCNNNKNVTSVLFRECPRQTVPLRRSSWPSLTIRSYGSGERVCHNRSSCTYKFLAGFDRRKIKSPFPVDEDEALHFLYNAPHEEILLMLKEIEKSKNDAVGSETKKKRKRKKKKTEKAFDTCLTQLKTLAAFSTKVPWSYKWVVGLDLFGDELGYPYCPFVARPFIEFVEERRKLNTYFGLRIHCGENVKFASHDNPAYRLFIAHMYIVFRCLLFLQQELKYGIRIGHGIAFDHILDENQNLSDPIRDERYRKSSVLMAEMRNNANYLFKSIAFEVNITSNEYLLGQKLRKANPLQILGLKGLFAMGAPIVLGTDDDGIWPLDQCLSVHPGHHSLAAEYCRAISTSLIDPKNLERTFETMKTFCFWDMKNDMQKTLVKNASSTNSPHMDTVIVHPDIIRLIYEEYNLTSLERNEAFKNFKIYPGNNDESRNTLSWEKQYGVLRVAFVCICADEEKNKEKLFTEYGNLFGNLDKDKNKQEFNFIYNNWQSILSHFVHCNTGTNAKIELISLNPYEQKHYAVYSAQSQSDDLRKFVECIHQPGKEIDIRAYAKEVNIEKTVRAFDKPPKRRTKKNSSTGIALIFTNTKKYTCAYSKDAYNKPLTKIECRLNPIPSNRDKAEENFLYVLCHHASAATAALNLISDQLYRSSRNSSTISSHSVDPVPCGKAKPSQSNTDDTQLNNVTRQASEDHNQESVASQCSNEIGAPHINMNNQHDHQQTLPNHNDDEDKSKQQT